MWFCGTLIEYPIIDAENEVEWQKVINYLRSQSKSGQNYYWNFAQDEPFVKWYFYNTCYGLITRALLYIRGTYAYSALISQVIQTCLCVSKAKMFLRVPHLRRNICSSIWSPRVLVRGLQRSRSNICYGGQPPSAISKLENQEGQ